MQRYREKIERHGKREEMRAGGETDQEADNNIVENHSIIQFKPKTR